MSSESPFESARSSTTLNPNEVDQYIARQEKRIEQYGGDDVHDPDPEKSLDTSLPDDTPLYVTWDGPEDPTNPQNWSKSYRWALTVLCSIMTVNVYVFIYVVYQPLIYKDTDMGVHSTFASSAPSAVTGRIVQNFGISMEVSYLVTSLFLVGYVVGVCVVFCSGCGNSTTNRTF
jgi:MFS transporter, DHA1 family, multidrug resistance protein